MLRDNMSETCMKRVPTKQVSHHQNIEVSAQTEDDDEGDEMLSASDTVCDCQCQQLQLGNQYTSVDISSLVDQSKPDVTDLCVISAVDDDGEMMTPVACVSSRDDDDVRSQLHPATANVSDRLRASSKCSANCASVLCDVQAGSEASVCGKPSSSCLLYTSDAADE